ncbi:MAG: glycoside hydrolase family 9 protein [Lachnospiraceae bacterium]|nr:glycoside hydrolase family 9 protein [Lachnospiraceae bacterium]MBO4807705.1 glycoside hydrolase family 9 protein [Lachnospiraceae bacterium]
MKSKTFPIITIACVMSLLVSCAVPGFRMEYVNEAEEFLSMNEEPHLYDTVPVVLPHIVTDKAGFESEAEKVAVFTSASIPQTFEIIDADTGRRAFSGVVKTKRNPGNGSAPLGYGYFTELTIPGNYYIKCAGLGESYPFVITDDLIRDIVPDALDVLDMVREKRITVKARDTKGAEVEKILQGGWITDENGTQDVTVAAETMMTLLTAYELFPMSFEEFTNDAGDIRILDQLYHQSVWMLSLQDETSGGVYRSLYTVNDNVSVTYNLGPVDNTASAAFAAVMAKFSYIYKDVDAEYASICLKAADMAWKYLEKEKAVSSSSPDSSVLASAAAELYRASGLQTYYTYANDLLPSNLDIEADHWNLYSSVTYMLTRKAVSVAKCQSLMKTLMKSGEVISQAARDDSFMVSTIDGDDSFESLLWNMVILSTSNYVLTNDEYASVIKNHEHYFRGRNFSSEDYIYDKDEYKLKDLRSNAAYIYMLAQILSGDYFVAPSDSDY